MKPKFTLKKKRYLPRYQSLKNIRKKNNREIQKGGSNPLEFYSIFQEECQKIMNILQPTESALPTGKYQEAVKIFLDENKGLNSRFFLPLFQYNCTGKKLYSVEPSAAATPTGINKDLYTYYLSLKKKVTLFSQLQTQRKIFYIKAHSIYGNNYFKLPKNITVCFLTGVNKFSFTEFSSKLRVFTPKFNKRLRKKYFDSMFSYHLNYFDKAKFNCARLGAKYFEIDYFRESTWYFPNQLCSNSLLKLNVDEFFSKGNFFGFSSVDETEYLETPHKSFLDHQFRVLRKETYLTNLQEVLTLHYFEPHLNYLVIIDGCRMLPYRDDKFIKDSQYNFIHYHITQKVCREVLKENSLVAEYIDIPDFTVTSRPRDYLTNKKHIYDEDREILKKKTNYNYFSFNNHLISYLLGKLKNVSYQHNPFYQKFKCFVCTLNYDKMLMLYEKLLETEGIDEITINKIMAGDMLRYKFECLCIAIDSLLGDKLDEYTLHNSFDIDIITSLMQRSEKLKTLLNIMGQKKTLSHFETNFPSFAGINFFNNSLISANSSSSASLNIQGLRRDCPKTLIVNVDTDFLINQIIDTLRTCVPQERVSFYKCNFGSIKKNFKNKEIEHLMLVRCKQFINTEINSNTKIFEIYHLENTMRAVFDTQMAESLILNQVNTESLLIRGCVLTYLELELKNTSTLAESFDCPKLQVFKLKFDRYSGVNNFTLPNSLYLREFNLHNINFENNSMWNFNEFRMLTKLTLERFKFNNNFCSISMLRNIEFISFKGIQNLVVNTLPLSLLKAKKLKHLYLFMVDTFGEVTEELIQMLLQNKVHVDADGSIDQLSRIAFY